MLTACRLAFILTVCLARKAENDDRTIPGLGTIIGLPVGAGVGAAGGAATGLLTGGLTGAALSNAVLNNPFIGGILGGVTGTGLGGLAGLGTGAGIERQDLSNIIHHILSCRNGYRQWHRGNCGFSFRRRKRRKSKGWKGERREEW